MIRLHYANRLETLAAPLADAVAAAQRTDPLAKIPIIVPNRSIEEFIKFHLAERLGVAANLRFPFLRAYLAEVVQNADPAIRVLEADRLQLVLFKVLTSAEHRADPELAPVRDYAAGSQDEADREPRLFQLAERIARLFQEYSISREAMIRQWRHGRQFTKAPYDQTERWQRHLWLAVFDDSGAVRPEWTGGSDCRWMLLPEAFSAARTENLRPVLPQTLHVFGLPSPAPAFVRIFERLGKLIELAIHAVNPCKEFWEDVQDSRGAIARDGWARRADRVGAAIEESEDPFALTTSNDPPALRFWGRPGREHIRLLNELTECDFDPHFSDPLDEHSSLLASLQHDILFRAPANSSHRDSRGDPDGDAIRMLACPGIRREVEIVANEIWALIKRDDQAASAAPIRFHEIAVLIPDAACDSYLPHIETVFARQHQIPVELVSRSYANESRVAEAIELLLQLPRGRFTREEMLRLLGHPAITGDDPDLDIERWSQWCGELGVFFGAGGSDLAGTYLSPDLYNWDQALTRLALGVFMAGEQSGDMRTMDAAGGGGLAPLEVRQDEAAGAARLIRTARALIADALSMRGARLRIGQWSRLLAALIGSYLKVSDADDQRIRDRCIAEIEAIAEPGLDTAEVPYAIAYEIAIARISSLGSQQGRFTARGVAAGSLAALQSIPFKAIFVLGLGETVFPERERRDLLDLRLERPRPGDVSPAQRDRYRFLDALLAARERLYLSYVERDAQTGDELEPSAVVRELQDILRSYLDDKTFERITVKHKLSRYDFAYFPDLPVGGGSSQALLSFDPDARRGARMSALRADLERHCERAPLPERARLWDAMSAEAREKLRSSLGRIEIPAAAGARVDVLEEISLPLSALRRFLECPLQGAARYALGMLDDDEIPEDAEDEPLAQSTLDRTMLLRQAFWAARGNLKRLSDEYQRIFRIAQMKGLAPAGPFADAARTADDGVLTGWIAQARTAGAADLGEWREFRIGHAAEYETGDKITIVPYIDLEVPIDDPGGKKRMRRVKIYGSAGTIAPDLGAAIQCVLRKEPKDRDFLGPALNAIALAAAERRVPSEFRAIVLGSSDAGKRGPAPWLRTFAPPSRDAAREYLSALVKEMMSARHDYFLPIEAVAAAIEEKERPEAVRDAVGAVEQVRELNPPSCSSDFGPIRNARSFDPPGESEIKDIIDRRYGPILAILKPAPRKDAK